MPRFLLSSALTLSLSSFALAETAWVQIESHPNLPSAQEAAQGYDLALDDVVGFDLGRGWYGIALGPYERTDAEALLRRLKAARAIPADSYVEEPERYGNQFYPIGTGAPITAQPLPAQSATQDQAAAPAASAPTASADDTAAAAQTPAPADETPRQARASESQLTRDEKRDLQTALKWAGVYSGAIDGLFGRGTRRSMESWQASKGFEQTGILTTAQRAQLFADYNAVLDGMGMAQIDDPVAGIRIDLPSDVVSFDHYDAPFAHYTATGDIDAQVLLISQQGDTETLAGLYEILQTLAIVPREGPRRLRNRNFTLEGISAQRHTYIEARLEQGQIKGFALVWPAGDDERRSRILNQMLSSFATYGDTLDPTLVSDASRAASDLVSSLAIRTPIWSRTGFFATSTGDVLTHSDGLDACGVVTLNAEHDMTITYRDDTLGLAVLSPQSAIAPRSIAQMSGTLPRMGSQVALAGFPYNGVLPSAALTFGTIDAASDLSGDTRRQRLSLHSEPSELGGPVMDEAGRVIGMLSLDHSDKSLPAGVSFALGAEAIIQSLTSAGLAPRQGDTAVADTPELITQEAGKMTVLLRCWE